MYWPLHILHLMFYPSLNSPLKLPFAKSPIYTPNIYFKLLLDRRVILCYIGMGIWEVNSLLRVTFILFIVVPNMVLSIQEILSTPQVVLAVKKTCLQCRRHKRRGFNPWFGKIPWRRKWQPTPVFLPGKSHGQRSLAGYSPWGHKELDMT